MLERDVERYLVKRIKDAGGKAYKWVSPGNSGVPDRIVILPGGRVAFVELKAPGEKPRALQEAQMRVLEKLGCLVLVVDSKAGVDDLFSRFYPDV